MWEWSVFAIIFHSDGSRISLFLLYLLISQNKAPIRGVFVIYLFACLWARNDPFEFSLASVFPPWPRDKGNCPPHGLHHLTLGGSRTGQVQLRCWWKFNSSPAQVDRSVSDPPKNQVNAGRGVQENTRQYREVREANVICVVFFY